MVSLKPLYILFYILYFVLQLRYCVCVGRWYSVESTTTASDDASLDELGFSDMVLKFAEKVASSLLVMFTHLHNYAVSCVN